MRECEDCGDEQNGSAGQARRTRCRNCGLLVCTWCWWHVHGLEMNQEAVVHA